LLAVASILVWPSAAWPARIPPGPRALSLMLFAGALLGALVAGAAERIWNRRRTRYLAQV